MSAFKPDIDKEIILVDDFSTDGTHEILLNLADNETQVLMHETWPVLSPWIVGTSQVTGVVDGSSARDPRC